MAKYLIGKDVKDLMGKSSGKPFKKFNVKDEKGVVTSDVIAFGNFSQYAAIQPGATVEAVLSEGEYNGKKDYKLVDGNLGAKPSGFGGGMAKTMEMKSAGIQKAQERKEDGIMISSTARDATQILTAFYPEVGEIADPVARETRIMNLWRKFRRLLIENWEPRDTVSDGALAPDFEPKGYPDSFKSEEEAVISFPEDSIPF